MHDKYQRKRNLSWNFWAGSSWRPLDVIIVCLLNLLLIVICLSMYAMIRMGTAISLSNLLLFSCALVDSVATDVLMFGAFASVHTQSSVALAYLKESVIPQLHLDQHRSGESRRRFELKVFKWAVVSLYPLKVRIGAVNFVEKITPIVMLNFFVEQITSLLLIK